MGILFSLLAAICYGLYSPLNKKQTYDPDLALMIVFGLTSVWCMILSVHGGTVVMPTPVQWVGLVLYGSIVNSVAYMCWVKALGAGNTAIMSNLIYLTPVVSLVFTHVVLGEEITVFSVVGLVLTIFVFEKTKVIRIGLYILTAGVCAVTGRGAFHVLPKGAFISFLIGSALLLTGVGFYALGKKKRYMHAVFHLFVIAGSLLQFFAILLYVMPYKG